MGLIIRRSRDFETIDTKQNIELTINYGDKILIHKNIQTIKNSGNPGSFNYQRYASFQQLFHTIFLKEKDWVKTNERQVSWFKQFIWTNINFHFQ